MKYLCLLLLICLSACFYTTSHKESTTINAAGSEQVNQLLHLYKVLHKDTLALESRVEGEMDNWDLSGAKIDTMLIPLLPVDLSLNDPNYFACYQFNLDSNTIGLVTRTPSYFASSSIKLFALHKQTNTITFETELAEVFGDAGDRMTKKSWLYHTPDSSWKGIMEEYNCTQDGDLEDTSNILETYDYYHFKWNNNRIDTVCRDSSALAIYKEISPKIKK